MFNCLKLLYVSRLLDKNKKKIQKPIKNFLDLDFGFALKSNPENIINISKDDSIKVIYHFKKNLKYFYSVCINEFEIDNINFLNTFPHNLKIKKLLKGNIIKKNQINDKMRFLLSLKHCLFISYYVNAELFKESIRIINEMDFYFNKLNFTFFNNIYVITKLINLYLKHSSINVDFVSTNNKYFSKKKRSIKKNRLKKLKRRVFKNLKEMNTIIP